jgi:hypothetical protein
MVCDVVPLLGTEAAGEVFDRDGFGARSGGSEVRATPAVAQVVSARPAIGAEAKRTAKRSVPGLLKHAAIPALAASSDPLRSMARVRSPRISTCEPEPRGVDGGEVHAEIRGEAHEGQCVMPRVLR